MGLLPTLDDRTTTMTDAKKDYEDSIKEHGFVPATKNVVVQVMDNTEAVAKLQTQMADVVEVLSKRLEKLEKK
jgi:DNA polymerase II large subunit